MLNKSFQIVGKFFLTSVVKFLNFSSSFSEILGIPNIIIIKFLKHLCNYPILFAIDLQHFSPTDKKLFPFTIEGTSKVLKNIFQMHVLATNFKFSSVSNVLMLHHHHLLFPRWKWNRDHLKTFYGRHNGKCLRWNFKVSDNLISFMFFCISRGLWVNDVEECWFYRKFIKTTHRKLIRLKTLLKGSWIFLWLIRFHLLWSTCMRSAN